VKPGSPTKAVPGYVVEILDEEGNALPANKEGAVVIRLPLPPGSLPTLWNADERYRATYLARYPGYYLTGDGGYIDEDGYLFIMGRVDDIIICAGHNISTGSIEQALAGHPDVAECAVFGVKDPLKTQIPIGTVVLKAGVTRDPEVIRAELVTRVRDEVGPVANFRLVRGGGAPAEDALGQGAAPHDAHHRRRRSVRDAGDHRRSGGPRGDPRGAAVFGIRA